MAGKPFGEIRREKPGATGRRQSPVFEQIAEARHDVQGAEGAARSLPILTQAIDTRSDLLELTSAQQTDALPVTPASRQTRHYHGHRERLRERFRGGGADALPDYELLELVLFGAHPQKDMKPIAKALIARFGSFAEAVNAPDARLKEIAGVGPAAITQIRLIAAAASRVAKGAIKTRETLGSWSAVLDYCRTAMAFADKEQFRILFLDKRNQLIADEVQQTGTVDHTPVYPREVVKRALELSATAIILVHNHPSGDPTPSNADIQMTKQIVEIAGTLGIAVHDHIIVGKNGHASLKGLKLM